MKAKLLITDVLRRDLRATRFCNRLAKRLIAKGGDAKQINLDKKSYFGKIRANLLKIDNNFRDLRWYLIPYLKSFEQAVQYLKMFSLSKKYGFDNYFNFETVASLLRKGKKNLDFYFNLARSFEHYQLDENEQGNFTKFGDYDSIDDEILPEIVDVMIYTKNTGYPLTQKNIIKFYDAISNTPTIKNLFEDEKLYKEKLIELLDSYKRAWVYQNENKLEIKTIDYIQAAKSGRDPFNFVVTFSRLIENDIPLQYEKFKIIPLPEATITQLIGYLIKAKFSGVLLNFDDLYQEIIRKVPVNTVLEFLIKFYKVGCSDFDYLMLRNLHFMGGDLKKFFEGYILNQKTIKLSAKELYDHVFKILSIADLKPKFDTFLFVIALRMAKENSVPFDEIIDDYISGYNVFSILDYVNFAKKNELNLNYGLAKLIDKFCDRSENDAKNCVKETIDRALNPVFIDGDSFLVTTKDNIEIKAKMKIEAVFIIENYFKGSDEKVLLDRASAIFIDEVQRKYDHDQIIMNIEKISNNVLDRLLKETRTQTTEYFFQDENNEPKVELHHNENNIHHTDSTDNNHKSEEHHNTDEHNHTTEIKHSDKKTLKLPKQSDKEIDKFINVSKYKPLKVLIPKIEFVEATFKEFEKAKHDYEHNLHEHMIHFKEKEAEIEIKKEWAKGNFNKYIIFKDDDENETGQHGHH
ncbi:MAG: hypothetical protein JXR68_10355 [Bacteroidales bacterium]|nr:hypothetical protein [Bacteroidales bacterium]